MPAKGADLIETGAPAKEPQAFSATGAGDSGVVCSRVAKRFATRAGEVAALAGVTLACERGGALGVVGPSGCGKSTLLELVCGLAQPSEGAVAVDGETSPAARLARCTLMPQRDLLMPWRTALDNAGLPLELQGASRARARHEAMAMLERFGLASFAGARPYELSGGMRQRVAFARTLLAGKPVLLLDEPFGSLDSITRAAMQEWLAGTLAGEPRTVVLVTHDVEEALYLCDRLVVLSPRPARVVADFPVSLERRRPRRELVTSPEFVSLRERALEALA